MTKIVLTSIITTLLCFSLSTVKAQAKSDTTYKPSAWIETGAVISDSFVSVVKWKNDRYEIKGDTLKVVQMLWKRLDAAAAREGDLWNVIGRAVDFTNGVPDYFKSGKTNKAWIEYQSALKLIGYKTVLKKR